MSFVEEQALRAQEIEGKIKEFLPEESGYQSKVIEAMNYSMQAGGKRIRPMLMVETFKLCGGKGDVVWPLAVALEMVHNYSLVHDDLPCMDNDEYRRGRKTTHVMFGEGMATLAGDGLLNYAMEVALRAFDVEGMEPQKVSQAIRVLFNKSGIYGMIGGQCADINAEDMDRSEITEEMLLYIHENKTAALIEAAMMIGGILAGATDITIRTLEKIAYNVGIAFQIMDDILDITATFEELGKPIGSDERNNKVTYVTLHGLEESKTEVKKLSEEAITLMHTLPGDNPFLEELLESMITRRK